MSISLITRAANGAPLSAAQNDQNLNAIQSEVNTLDTNVANLQTSAATFVSTTALNAQFAGVSGGKQQISWANVLNKTATTAVAFKVRLNTAAITINSSSTPTNTAIVYDLVRYDSASAFSTISGAYTIPVAGVWHFDASLQVQFVSGTVTGGENQVMTLLVNGGTEQQWTFDLNVNTGIRIMPLSTDVKLSVGDTVSIILQMSQGSSTSVWQIANNTNTTLAGHLVGL